ncbi:Integron integrase IntIPac [Acinetobacter baumannii]|nr:IntI1 integrase [Acinetobacter baumannii]AOX74189.1 Integron integrase IntIPac [Acinetobacter baumannii]AOX80838.1 Integron integrase IntIPac [Acinetobacter baumannii]AOX85833.1 Integron integrase IntIPac [Acinetobacter baumannii]AOX89691.1 Integron integrase IntIPac [Acinetobacter baumannii]
MKTATAPLPPLRSVKVLDQLRERIRYLHYSLPTEQAYVNWVRAFIRFHGVRHPATLGSSEVEAFLSWLANERKVSVSTHRQALAALLFFYGKVLCTDLPWLQEIGRPRPSRRLPVVLTPDEGHCCKVSDEAAFCLIQRPYISKTLLTRRISPRGSP